MNPGRAAAGLSRVARIDLEAFSANLRNLLAGDPALVLDARADAYGHGLEHIVPVALDSGVTTIRVSPRDTARHGALPGIRRSALMTVPSVRALVADEAYGLAGDTRAVMTLVGEVIATKRAEAGAGVSYGYSYRTASETTLALVGLGYADGVPRLASNRASVFLAGATAPVVGRIAMDQFVVDCGDLTPPVGHEVVLFGDREAGHPTAGEWAVHTERSATDLTAGLGTRIDRTYS